MTHYEKQDIRSLLLEDIYFLRDEHKYNAIAGFLFGSQNYNINTIGSDIDRKVIVVPSLTDLVHNKQLNREYKREWGLCHVYDIRDFVKNLIKGASTQWELLITDCYSFCGDSHLFYSHIYPYKDCIIRMNPIGGIKSIYGQYHSYVKLIFPQDSESYNKKAFVNAIRIKDLLDKYYEFINNPELSVNNFDLLVPKNPGQLKIWKTDCPFNYQEAEQFIKEYNTKMEERYKKILEECEDKVVNVQMKKILEEYRYRTIKRAICDE